jgi:outer membrane protein TolC
LVESEKSFWDFIYLQEELKLRQANLDRAQRILTWVQRRVNDGISDRADLLNAKALLINRKFQLQTSQDDLKTAQQKIIDVLEIKDSSQLPTLEGSIHQVRNSQYYIGGQGHVVTIEAYAKSLEAKALNLVSEEVRDGLKSDIVLSGSYSSNPYKPDGSLDYVSSNLTNFDKPTTAVSLTWVYLFDTSVKSAQASQARKQALSGQLKNERALLESESQWKEFKRHYNELNQKILTAQEISQIQTERAKAEQDKFTKGRSITQYVITAEQDAAEAELNLTKLKAEQRKLEAQGRFFISIKENL